MLIVSIKEKSLTCRFEVLILGILTIVLTFFKLKNF